MRKINAKNLDELYNIRLSQIKSIGFYWKTAAVPIVLYYIEQRFPTCGMRKKIIFINIQ